MCKWVQVFWGCKHLSPILAIILTKNCLLSSLEIVVECVFSLSSFNVVARLDSQDVFVL
jgi:hypothetical protein